MNSKWTKYINSFARNDSFSKLSELSTGVLYGGVITSDYTSNKVDIQEGLGQILIKQDNYEYIKEVSWATQIDYEITNVGIYQYTAIYVDQYGRILQKKSMLSNEELQNNVLLGIVFHVDNIKVNQIVNQKTVSLDSPMRLINLLNNLGLMKIEGLSIETNPGSLKLNRSEGTVFGLGVNYFSGSTNVDEISLSGETNCSLQYVYRDSSGGTVIDNNGGAFYSNVIPGSYDDGSGVLQSVGATEWSVQRCFLIPENPAEIIITYGQNKYTTYNEARSSLEFESFEVPEVLEKTSVFLGYMIIRGGAADLSITGDCRIIQGGFIRNLPVGGGGGGGGSVTTPAFYDEMLYTNFQCTNKTTTTLNIGSNTGLAVGFFIPKKVQIVKARIEITAVAVNPTASSFAIYLVESGVPTTRLYNFDYNITVTGTYEFTFPANTYLDPGIYAWATTQTIIAGYRVMQLPDQIFGLSTATGNPMVTAKLCGTIGLPATFVVAGNYYGDVPNCTFEIII